MQDDKPVGPLEARADCGKEAYLADQENPTYSIFSSWNLRFAFDLCVLLFLMLVALMGLNAIFEQYYKFDMLWVEDQAASQQILWNFSHRLRLETTILHPTQNALGTHFNLIYIPLSLFHLVWAGPETLWVTISLALALSMFLLYKLATPGCERASGRFS